MNAVETVARVLYGQEATANDWCTPWYELREVTKDKYRARAAEILTAIGGAS